MRCCSVEMDSNDPTEKLISRRNYSNIDMNTWRLLVINNNQCLDRVMGLLSMVAQVKNYQKKKNNDYCSETNRPSGNAKRGRRKESSIDKTF